MARFACLAVSVIAVSVLAGNTGASVPPSLDAVAWGRVDLVGVDLEDEAKFSKPVEIGSVMGGCITSVSTGDFGTIFTTCAGFVYVTGTNVGLDGDFKPDTPADGKTTPLRAVGALAGHNVTMAAAGDHHFMALTTEGKVFAWGLNDKGQLALDDPELPYATEPTEIKELSNRNVRYITARAAKSAAVTDIGKLFVWGENIGSHGEIDYSRNAHKPHLVSTIESPVCQVSMGDSHIAALTRNGNLFEWGDGAAGQLGLGDFKIKRSKPSLVSRLRKNVCYVEAAFDYTVAVTQDERLFLWGSNGYSSPFEKVYLQGMHPVQAGAGRKHIVVLLKNGTVVTWGSSKLGQVGRETGKSFTLDAGSLDWDGEQQFSFIAVGGDQTVAVASGVSAPSLCACNGGAFSRWFEEVRYEATCTPDQTACGDGACCTSDQTCCKVSDDDVYVGGSRAINNMTEAKSSFVCVDVKQGNCCGSSGRACPSGFKCNLEGGESNPGTCRCEPDNHRQMSEIQLAFASDFCAKAVPGRAKPAGKAYGEGSCGSRKETCPDETCCQKGFTCCKTADGYGCCQTMGGTCCDKGCCAKGYECDESGGGTCRKKDTGTALVLVPRGDVDSQCGANRARCPDSSCCKKGKTCCVLQDGNFGCCPHKNGVCCSDGAGCCPPSHTCDLANNRCVKQGTEVDPSDPLTWLDMVATPRNTPQRSEASIVRCSDEYVCSYPGTCSGGDAETRCCPFNNGVFCGADLGCCPQGYACDEGGNGCKPLSPSTGNGHVIPRKLTRAATRLPSLDQQIKAGQAACNEGEKVCDDNTCCARGSKCCTGGNGHSVCCDMQSATCCGNGCCAAGHGCDEATGKCIFKGVFYDHVPSVPATVPKPTKEVRSVSAPGKCYDNERTCSNGECCPSQATCCNFGLGEFGCCPQHAAKCCEGGGCCPSGSECPAPGSGSSECVLSDGTKAPKLSGESPNSPSVEYDLEECFADEQTCFDGGCCKAEGQTCCTIEEPGVGQVSVCCEIANAICCPNGQGCCAEGEVCLPEGGCGDGLTGAATGEGGGVKETGVHPISALPEIDCPDGSVCGPYDTCCSLGYDEEWDEEIYACCPFENGVCCTEFEGCCPSSYMCDGETKECVMDGKLLASGDNAPTDPPPIFVCDVSTHTQCPNGRCCESDEVCTAMPSGNYKCVERNYTSCASGKYACPQGLWCDLDEENDKMMCSKEVDTPNAVKESLLREYWGDDEAAAAAAAASADKNTNKAKCAARCAANAALIELGEGLEGRQDNADDNGDSEGDGHSPEVVVETPPQTLYWYPKKLRPVSRAKRTSSTSLPTVQAGKVCQHFGQPIVVEDDMCFLSNQNGHFAATERVRVEDLVEEYKRRTCVMQSCLGAIQEPYTFVPEDLDPCPCRERPAPPVDAEPEEEAGSGDAKIKEVIEEVAAEEEQAAPMVVVPANDDAAIGTNGGQVIVDEKPATLGILGQKAEGDAAAAEVVDEDDVSFEAAAEAEAEEEAAVEVAVAEAIKKAGNGTSAAAAAAAAKKAASAAATVHRVKRKPRPAVPRRTLVPPVADEMQLYSTYADSATDAADSGDKAMMLAQNNEPVLANCNDSGSAQEDGAEEAVDLDGKAARDADAAIEEEEK